MNDSEALLRTIAAVPDEDTPRLVFADYLDELGGEANSARARFIRVQIDLARNPGRSWFANADRIEETARLAARFADSWLNELPKWAASAARTRPLGSDDFPRGFMSTFHIDPATFTLKGNELLDVAPITRIVAVAPLSRADLTALFVSPFLLRVRELQLAPTDGDLAATFIKTSRVLHTCEELDLSICGLTDAGATSLTESLTLTRLRALIARGNRLTESGIASLLSAPNLPNLQTLDVYGAPGSHRWGRRLRARFPQKTVLV